MIIKFPEPDCEMGFSWKYLEEIMDAQTFAKFTYWMRGQTCSICTGTSYNHEAKVYEDSPCVASPHGGVAYSWDVKRFLGIIPGKEIFD